MDWFFCSVIPNSAFNEELIKNWSKGSFCGFHLEPVPDWVKEDEALGFMSWTDREKVRGSELAFTLEYQAEALGSPDPDWKGDSPRSVQKAIEEKVFLTGVALWMAKPSPISGGPMFHFDRPGDPTSLRSSSSFNPIQIAEHEQYASLSYEDLKMAGFLLAELLLLNRKATIWIAVDMLTRALPEKNWIARYLWLWIVLEALFGPGSPGETKISACNENRYVLERQS